MTTVVRPHLLRLLIDPLASIDVTFLQLRAAETQTAEAADVSEAGTQTDAPVLLSIGSQVVVNVCNQSAPEENP